MASTTAQWIARDRLRPSAGGRGVVRSRLRRSARVTDRTGSATDPPGSRRWRGVEHEVGRDPPGSAVEAVTVEGLVRTRPSGPRRRRRPGSQALCPARTCPDQAEQAGAELDQHRHARHRPSPAWARATSSCWRRSARGEPRAVASSSSVVQPHSGGRSAGPSRRHRSRPRRPSQPPPPLGRHRPDRIHAGQCSTVRSRPDPRIGARRRSRVSTGGTAHRTVHGSVHAPVSRAGRAVRRGPGSGRGRSRRGGRTGSSWTTCIPAADGTHSRRRGRCRRRRAPGPARGRGLARAGAKMAGSGLATPWRVESTMAATSMAGDRGRPGRPRGPASGRGPSRRCSTRWRSASRRPLSRWKAATFSRWTQSPAGADGHPELVEVGAARPPACRRRRRSS